MNIFIYAYLFSVDYVSCGKSIVLAQDYVTVNEFLCELVNG